MNYLLFGKKPKRATVCQHLCKCAVALFLLFSALTARAQIGLDLQNVTFSKAISEIKNKTHYRFLYNDELIAHAKPVTIHVKDADISKVMDALTAGRGLTYSIIDGTITIMAVVKKTNPVQESNQQQEVTGKVTDSTGTPLSGVGVTIKDGQRGVVTDADGIYSILAKKGDVLEFHFVGYLVKDVTVGEIGTSRKNLINVVLSESENNMNDIVVIGYGIAKRKDLTGAVASVKVEGSPIAQLPVSSPLDLLKGNVSGLNIGVANSAGSQPSMLIRGQNSVNGNTDPLIILDGVIYLGSLNDINPNDIATVDVLKDAVSASVYGSRSANGIIAITTKKGKRGRPAIDLNTTYGAQTWQKRPVMMSGAQWFKSVNDRNSYTAGSTSWMKTGELENYKNGKETNWLDVITRTGTFENDEASISGASDNVNYYLSTSYNNNLGIIDGDRFKRISVLSKVDAKVTRWLEVGLDGAYNVLNYSGISANVFIAEQMSPYGVMYRDSLHDLEKYPVTQSEVNPLWGVNDGTVDDLDKRQNFRLNTFAVVSAPWVKGLSYRLNYSANVDKNESGDFYHENYFIAEGEGIQRYSPSVVSGFLTSANGNLQQVSNLYYVMDNILNYKNKFGLHDIDFTAVATRDFTRDETTNITGSNFAANGNTLLGIWGLSKATVQQNALTVTQRTNIGYLARLNYEYDNKYMLTASIRRDGASVFGTNKKWGNFKAAGIAWNVSNEDFMKKITFVNNLKLKLSYGQNGNQGIDPYGTLATVVNGISGGYRYEFSNTGSTIYYGLAQSALGNNDLGWEKTGAWNFGVEGAVLQNRVMMDLNLYTSKTTDQHFQEDIPVMTGFQSITASLGQVNNKGLELALTTVNIQRKDFNWTSVLDYWINRNKLVHLYGTDNDGDGKEDDDIANSLFIGKSLGAIYGYEQIGIVQPDDKDYIALNGAAPGDPKYKDLDGVPGISVNDRKILGYAKENFRMSLANTLSYKNFELYALIEGIFGGNGYYMASNPGAYMTRTNLFNSNSIYVPYWTPENLSNVYPSATYSPDSRFLGLQSRTFVRLQDVSLSYIFHQNWMKRLQLSNLRVFFAGKNLLTLTGWKGGDPELGNTVRDNTIPVPTTYSFGLSAGF